MLPHTVDPGQSPHYLLLGVLAGVVDGALEQTFVSLNPLGTRVAPLLTLICGAVDNVARLGDGPAATERSGTEWASAGGYGTFAEYRSEVWDMASRIIGLDPFFELLDGEGTALEAWVGHVLGSVDRGTAL